MSGVADTAARMPEPPDAEAEAACRKAEHDREFAAFVEDSYHRVEQILLARCWDREVVQDALNDAYLHGRVQWPKIRSYAKPIGWLIITARNKIRKEQQRRQREATVAPEDLPPAPAGGAADSWEAEELLRTWLHQLPSRHAEVFQMDRAGFSNHEIARVLGLAESSIRAYKLAAKRRLRELAHEAGYDGRRRLGGSRGPR